MSTFNAEMLGMIAEISELRALEAASKDPLRREIRRKLDRLDALRAQAAKRFAGELGWTVCGDRGRFPVDALKGIRGGDKYQCLDLDLFDHCEFYKLDRKPVAIISHPYRSPDTALMTACADGLKAHVLRLPSWYYPCWAIAVAVVHLDYELPRSFWASSTSPKPEAVAA